MGMLCLLKRKSYTFKKNINDLPEILIVLGGSTCTLMMGAMLTWSSPAIPALLSPEYNITIEEASYLTVIDPVTMMVGSPLFAKVADTIGRRSTMFFVPLMFVMCYLTTAFTKDIYILYISRMFAGLGYACSFSCAPTYFGEVTSPKIRSRYGHVLMTMVFVGQFLPNLVGFYFDIPTMAYILLTVPVIAVAIIYFLPESPYYHAMKNNSEKARKSLEILRGTKTVDDELRNLTTAVQRQLTEPGHFKDLFLVPSNRKALIICNVARVIQQFCGATAFVAFTQYIFEQSGIPISGGVAAMIFTGMLVVSNVFSNIVCDRVGKRLAMVYSCAGVSLVLFAETAFFFLQQYTNIDTTPASWFPVLGLVIYVIFFCMGQSSVPTLLLGELFSSNIKPHGVMCMNIICAVYFAVTNKLFQYLMSTFGLCIPFLMFALCAFIGAFLSYYLIPETKGKTLEEIQMMLKGIKTNL